MALAWRRRRTSHQPATETPESAAEVVQQLAHLTQQLRVEVDRLERLNDDAQDVDHHNSEGRRP